AVNHMYSEGIQGVDFFICNTDAQALEKSPIMNKVQIGSSLTEGRGAGSNPEIGRKAAEESIHDIIESLGSNTQMVFITAGMGGGTGTGAAPVIAKAAKDKGILTVGIVTTPFMFEGNKRCTAAFHGIEEIRDSVDSLLVVSNDRIKEIYGNLPISKAFGYADNILTTAAKGIAEIITIAGSINVDFEDVKTAMTGSGVSIMGMGTSEGDDRAMRAVSQALNSPLLDDNKIQGASDLLVNISYGDEEATMDEYATINEYLQTETGSDANLKCGLCYDENLGRSLSVTVIATGFNRVENRYNAIATNSDVEYNLGGVNVNENLTTEELDAQKQITIFDSFANSDSQKDSNPIHSNKSGQEGIEKMENIPAYKRRNVTLNEVNHSSEMEISRTSLIEEPESKPELKTNNSFLHDNVD
ncbi:MAG: cell division protein FtsZ, partial [Bacteroidia bacterium]|nr:cell division protein FtsZ [Bacteroidia bacterium]